MSTPPPAGVRPLLRLALPFAVGNLLGLANLVIDRFWVGRVGTEAMASLGAANAALMILITASMGMAVGTLAGVARATGARDPERAGRFFRQGLLLGWAIGLLFALAAIPFPRAIIEFINPGTADGPAIDYLRISMVGMLVQVPLQTLTFGLQGAGEARTAMRLSAISPILNAALDPLFIFGFDLGLPGAAWATVLATALALAFAWSTIRRRSGVLAPAGPRRPDWTIQRRILAVGFPGTLEHLVRTIASFALVKLLARFGPEVLSAYTTSMMLMAVLIFPGLALGQATASLVGRQLGAGQPEQAWRTAWTAVGLYLAFMTAFGGLLYFLAAPLVGFFDPNPTVVAEGERLLHIVALCFPFLSVAFVLSRAFAGAGTTLPAMLVAAFAHLLFQIPVVRLLAEAYGSTGAYTGMALAFVVQGILSAAVFAWQRHPSRLTKKAV